MNFLATKSVGFDYLAKKHEHKKISISSNLDSYMRILISALFFLSSFFLSPFGKLNAGSWLQISQQNSFWSQKPTHTFWFRKLNSIEKFAKNNQLLSIFVPREEIAHLKKTFSTPLNEGACTQLKQKCIQKLLSLKNSESIYFELEDSSHENFSIKLNVRRMQAPYPVNDNGMIDADGLFTCQICADLGCGNADLNCQANKLPMLPAIEIYAEKELSPWIKNMITSCIAPQSWVRLHKKSTGALAITGLFFGYKLLANKKKIAGFFNQTQKSAQKTKADRRADSISTEEQRRLIKLNAKIAWLLLPTSPFIISGYSKPAPIIEFAKIKTGLIKDAIKRGTKRLIVNALDLGLAESAAYELNYSTLFKDLFPEKASLDFGRSPEDPTPKHQRCLNILIMRKSVFHNFTMCSQFSDLAAQFNEYNWKFLLIADVTEDKMSKTPITESVSYVLFPTERIEKNKRAEAAQSLLDQLYPAEKAKRALFLNPLG